MDEHDDDLESIVHEDAAEESDDFPNTGDELDDLGSEDAEENDQEVTLDEDEAEL